MSLIGKITAQLTLDDSRFLGRLQGAGKKLEVAARKMVAVGGIITASLSVPIAGAALAIGKAAVDFETGFAGVRKTVDASESQFATLQSQFRDLAQRKPVPVGDLLRIGQMAGQLGIEVPHIATFTSTVADLSVAVDGISGEHAATEMARLANITRLPQEQLANLGAALVALGNNFPAMEGEILDFGQRLATSGSVIKLHEGQILGFGAALASVGINAEAGGTAFSRVFQRLGEAVAVGGPKLEKFAAVAGQSAEQFRQAFQQDAGEAIVQFIEGFAKQEEQGRSLFVVLKDLGFNNDRLKATLLAAAGAGDLLRRSMQLGTRAFHENTALTKEAGERYKTAAAQIQIAKNVLNDYAITAGGPLASALVRAIKENQGLFGAVKSLADGFAALNPKTQSWVIGIGAAAVALGPLLLGAGALAAAVTALIPVLGAVGSALLGPVGVALYVTTIAVALLYANWDRLGEIAKTTWAEVKVATLTAIVAILDGFAKLTRVVPTLHNALKAAADDMRNRLDTALGDQISVEIDTAPMSRIEQTSDAISYLGRQVDTATQSWTMFGEESVAASTAAARATTKSATGGTDTGDPKAAKKLADAFANLRGELAAVRGEAQLFGPSFDAIAAELSASEGGLQSLLRVGLKPTSLEARQLRDRIVALRADTSTFNREMEHAAQLGAIFGNQTGSLESQLHLVEDRIASLMQQAGGELTPAIIDLQARWATLTTAVESSRVFDEMAADAKMAARGLAEVDTKLAGIVRRSALLREGSLASLDAQVAALESSLGAAAEQNITGPQVDLRVDQLAQLKQSQTIARGIEGFFTTAADNIGAAF